MFGKTKEIMEELKWVISQRRENKEWVKDFEVEEQVTAVLGIERVQ